MRYQNGLAFIFCDDFFIWRIKKSGHRGGGAPGKHPFLARV